MTTQRIWLPGDYFNAEITNSLFKLGNAAITLDGAKATVTLAAHLLATGDYVTFSAAGGVTAINNSTWGPVTVSSSSVYTFPTTLTGTVTGAAIIQEKLFFFPTGFWVVLLGANGIIEYNPDNALGLNSGVGPIKGATNGGIGGEVWRTFAAASTAENFQSDGYSFRFRENGTTASSVFSQVK